jgi:hypothetical protein
VRYAFKQLHQIPSNRFKVINNQQFHRHGRIIEDRACLRNQAMLIWNRAIPNESRDRPTHATSKRKVRAALAQKIVLHGVAH